MRIALSDDPWPLGQHSTSARVLLDEDRGGPGCCAPTDGPDEAPGVDTPPWQLRLRQRYRTGFDPEDGVPLYGWADVWEGPAWVTSSNRGLALNHGRQETSDAGGQTFETVTALLTGVPKLDVTETAVAWDPDGNRWEITGVEPGPGGTSLRMERVVDDAT